MKVKIYRPRPSKGWLFNGLVFAVLFFVASTFVVCFISLKRSGNGGFISFFFIGITFFLLSIIMLASFVFLLLYPTMRYELSEDKLTFRCGPLKTEIPLSSIKEIKKKNLKYDISSTGWKLPGYCLFKIKYADEDWVRMYSRAMLKNITLIETNKEKFGITPADEEDFLKDIMEKIQMK